MLIHEQIENYNFKLRPRDEKIRSLSTLLHFFLSKYLSTVNSQVSRDMNRNFLIDEREKIASNVFSLSLHRRRRRLL